MMRLHLIVVVALHLGLGGVIAFSRTKFAFVNKISHYRAIKWDDFSNDRAPQNSIISDGPIREIISRVGVDIPSMYQTFSVQGLLLNAVIISSIIFNIDVTYFATSTSIFDLKVWRTVILFTGALLGSTVLFNAIPFKPVAQLKRNAHFAALERYGLTRSTFVAIGVALVSTCAGIVEELAFRGLCFGFAQKAFGGGPLEALFFSSVLYALYHMTVYKTNPIIDSLLGTIYTLAFYVTGDLNERIRAEEIKLDEEIKLGFNNGGKSHTADEASIRALFGLLDVDKDGVIDEKEWALGLRLFGFTPSDAMRGSGADLISNIGKENTKEGEDFIEDQQILKTKREIKFDEFAAAMRDTLRINSWPRKKSTP